jgi:hypothetical protein
MATYTHDAAVSELDSLYGDLQQDRERARTAMSQLRLSKRFSVCVLSGSSRSSLLASSRSQVGMLTLRTKEAVTDLDGLLEEMSTQKATRPTDSASQAKAALLDELQVEKVHDNDLTCCLVRMTHSLCARRPSSAPRAPGYCRCCRASRANATAAPL